VFILLTDAARSLSSCNSSFQSACYCVDPSTATACDASNSVSLLNRLQLSSRNSTNDTYVVNNPGTIFAATSALQIYGCGGAEDDGARVAGGMIGDYVRNGTKTTFSMACYVDSNGTAHIDFQDFANNSWSIFTPAVLGDMCCVADSTGASASATTPTTTLTQSTVTTSASSCCCGGSAQPADDPSTCVGCSCIHADPGPSCCSQGGWCCSLPATIATTVTTSTTPQTTSGLSCCCTSGTPGGLQPIDDPSSCRNCDCYHADPYGPCCPQGGWCCSPPVTVATNFTSFHTVFTTTSTQLPNATAYGNKNTAALLPVGYLSVILMFVLISSQST